MTELETEFPGRLRIISGDALEVDERAEAGDGAHIVANLPYNVGTALLLRWLGGSWPPWWSSLTLMFQREVAERIVAKPQQRTLWSGCGCRAVAVEPADRHGSPPLSLRASAESSVGGGSYRPS